MIIMSPGTYLSVPVAEAFSRRNQSYTEHRAPYMSTGGFVNIQHLARTHETHRRRRRKPKLGFIEIISSRSPISRATLKDEDFEIRVKDLEPLSPYRSDCWSSPETPRTPFAESRQTVHGFDHCHELEITPPPISKFSRHSRDFGTESSPTQSRFSHKCHLSEQVRTGSAVQLRPRNSSFAELPGSLLLPSQGYPQSNPPEVPLHVSVRSYSAQVLIDTKKSPSSTADANSVQLGSLSKIPTSPHSPMSTFRSTEMARSNALNVGSSRSLPIPYTTKQGGLPTRKSSLRSKMALPAVAQTPIPLSQMTIEDLVKVLPNLDAAIIAHDWIPCMQRRCAELKETMESLQRASTSDSAMQDLDQGLSKAINESQDLARAYHTLFDVAKDLQGADLEAKNAEIDDLNAQLSEAKIALVRFTSEYEANCQQHKRELQERRDLTRHIYDKAGSILRQFIGSVTNDLHEDRQEPVHRALEILTMTEEGGEVPLRYIDTRLYHETKADLNQAEQDNIFLKDICTAQLTTIKEQSRELDDYIARITALVTTMQDCQRENQTLRAQVEEWKLTAETLEKAGLRTSVLEEEHTYRTISQTRSLDENTHEKGTSVQDAEIANLREKLEQALRRENEFQNQIRSLLQTSQQVSQSGPVIQRHGRFKRLLTSGARGVVNLPSTASMHNLSQSIHTPFETDIFLTDGSSSSSKSGRISPTLAGLCEPGSASALELPPSHRGHTRTRSSIELGPRLRESLVSSLDGDIKSAVSHRFHHMPSNVRSTAPNSRPRTLRNNNSDSHDEIAEIDRPRSNFFPEPDDHNRSATNNHQRVLSGITEVTEDTGSVKRKSSSPDFADRKMYYDGMQALGRLQIHY